MFTSQSNGFNFFTLLNSLASTHSFLADYLTSKIVSSGPNSLHSTSNISNSTPVLSLSNPLFSLRKTSVPQSKDSIQFPLFHLKSYAPSFYPLSNPFRCVHLIFPTRPWTPCGRDCATLFHSFHDKTYKEQLTWESNLISSIQYTINPWKTSIWKAV